MEVFQERLREMRKKAGLTQEAAAKEIGISFRSYRRCESGECEPGFYSVVKIAEYFQVSLDYLAGRSDTPKP